MVLDTDILMEFCQKQVLAITQVGLFKTTVTVRQLEKNPKLTTKH